MLSNCILFLTKSTACTSAEARSVARTDDAVISKYWSDTELLFEPYNINVHYMHSPDG